MPGKAAETKYEKAFREKKEHFSKNVVDEAMRPANIIADVKEMERRKRVSLILNSEAFRQELEAIVADQSKTGNNSGLAAIQELAELVTPVPASYSINSQSKGSSQIPIADLRGSDASQYTKSERVERCKLAALLRLVDQQNWSQTEPHHISLRSSETLLVNPNGLLYREISASTLIKTDLEGNVKDVGWTTFSVDKNSFDRHIAIYKQRPDVNCIVHLDTAEIQAISLLKDGLLLTCREACALGNVSYHNCISDEDSNSVANSLGPINKIVILRNKSALICCESVAEAWLYSLLLIHASFVQLKALQAVGGNKDQLILVPNAIAEKVRKETATEDERWKAGEMEFEAQMRDLDAKGLRTGYIYRNPLIKLPPKSTPNEFQNAPVTVTSGYYSDSEVLRMGRKSGRSKTGGYQRLEESIFSDGEAEPITKVTWVTPEEASRRKREEQANPNQFAPQGENPLELREKTEEIKDDRMMDVTKPGYQSKILEGMNWVDLKKVQDAGGITEVTISASKGIIQKEHRNDALFFTEYSEKNPFESVSEDEVAKYQRDLERKARGEPTEDEEAAALKKAKEEERKQKEREKAVKKSRAATLPASPPPPTIAEEPIAKSSTLNGAESETAADSTNYETGMTTGAETDTAVSPTDKKKKKSKSFLKFGKSKNK